MSEFAAQPGAALADAFGLAGGVEAVRALGRGHIHATWWVRSGAGEEVVLQRLNTEVFRDPAALMRNVLCVTQQLDAQLADRGVADRERRRLHVRTTRAGASFCDLGEDGAWRAFAYVGGTRTVDLMEDAKQARAAGYAFGAFAAALADLDPAELAETIPHFHDLPQRVRALDAAFDADACGRAAAAAEDRARALALVGELSGELERAEFSRLPQRVVHNDCKLNNLLLDSESGEPLCVVDLDTVMPGTLLADFGELTRTGACPAPEDETDLSRVQLDLALFEAIARGYCEGAAPILSEREIGALHLAPALLALENGVRFLTDHLSGDVYFRVHREAHNLDRARAQLRLAEHAGANAEPLRALVRDAARRR